ncbi:WecB/TagA/CpsF family glycosyltransferase [Sulfitobacter sp. F26204]|uniref:WecB/TagA/CpsF family glycosyltransferase n=1 Tax=Sulfitobacter sp. F26204 TaxID=2996014 RepID=UPI00225DEE68|nr:WecB/TagA/CpsF family glycosyltransferase [Sulfitobacter sp. F26204]MCX7559221.1 WecB/TagA/CpsF family glycosyltransferase [Sulfitobacter sp. F26204]
MKFGKEPYQVEVNTATRDALFRTVEERITNGSGFALATLNLDHLTKLPVDPAFLSAYRAHDLVVADGRPVVWLARLAGAKIDLMPGSDMIVPLCEICAALSAPIALVGSSDAALEGAAKALCARVPGLVVSYSHAPPYGFDPAGRDADRIFASLTASGAALCFIALGAPKQEVFAARGRSQSPGLGFVSIGAGLDFLSGHQVRAPKVMRMLALEWMWRALQSPKRMFPRYARCFAILPGLVMQALRHR